MKQVALTACALFAFLCTPASFHEARAAEGVVVQQDVIKAFPEQEIGLSSASVRNGMRETVDVPVISWRDMPFRTVKKQGLDYSCGSAAISTLLTYVYGTKTSEQSVFKAMFEKGDQEKIRREGFSLLDMSHYLNAQGYKAAGYRVGLEEIEKSKAPFVALIKEDGYNHFVVVKSIRGPFVLIGDPNKGNVILHRPAFESMWNGIALIVVNHAKIAKSLFDNDKEWTFARSLARPTKANLQGIDSTVLAPIPWQIAPVRQDILSGVLTTNLLSGGGVP